MPLILSQLEAAWGAAADQHLHFQGQNCGREGDMFWAAQGFACKSFLFICRKAGESCADNPKIVSNFSWDKYKFLATDTPFKVCFDSSYTKRRFYSLRICQLTSKRELRSVPSQPPSCPPTEGLCTTHHRAVRERTLGGSRKPGLRRSLHHPWTWNPTRPSSLHRHGS